MDPSETSPDVSLDTITIHQSEAIPIEAAQLQSDEDSRRRRVAGCWPPVLVGFTVGAVLLVLLASFLAAPSSKSSYDAVVSAACGRQMEVFAQAGNTASASLRVPSTCTEPCFITLTYTSTMGSPLLTLYLRNATLPRAPLAVLAMEVPVSTPFTLTLDEGAGDLAPTCSRATIESGECVIVARFIDNHSTVSGLLSLPCVGPRAPSTSRTPSYTPSASRTGTPTISHSASSSPLASVSATAAASGAVSSSATGAVTTSSSASPTASGSPTPSTSSSMTTTVSSSVTASSTVTRSASFSATPSPLPSGLLVTDFAGQRVVTYRDGVGTDARFADTLGVAADSAGILYVTDQLNHRIRKMTSNFVVSTLAGDGTCGSADGTGVNAQLCFPRGMAIDSGDNIYVTASYNIRKVTPAGVVTTIAGTGDFGFVDGASTTARFAYPISITIDASGNLYVCDYDNYAIRKITPAGDVSTLAGGTEGLAVGTGTSARFDSLGSILYDPANDWLYASDRDFIRKVTLAGVVTAFVGSISGSTNFADGTGTSVVMHSAPAMTLDPSGDVIFVDRSNFAVRKMTSSGVVTTILGGPTKAVIDTRVDPIRMDGTGTNALFNSLFGVAALASGDMYVTESVGIIRKITSSNVVTTVAGWRSNWGSDGVGTNATFNSPAAITFDADDTMYVAEWGANNIRKITSSGVVTTLAGYADGFADGSGTAAQFSYPRGIDIGPTGDVFVTDAGNNAIRKVTPAGVVTTVFKGDYGNSDGTGTNARISFPGGIQVRTDGTILFADEYNHKIRSMDVSGGTPVITTLAGQDYVYDRDGVGMNARFVAPGRIAMNADSTVLYVSDTGKSAIRQITMAGVVMSTIAGGTYGYVDATGTDAQFGTVGGMAFNAAGDVVIADSDYYAIRVLSNGVVTTLAGGVTSGSADGTGTSAQFGYMQGLAVAADGDCLVVEADTGRIRRVTPLGVVTTFAGSASGYTDATGTSAEFNQPYAIAVDSVGNAFVADMGNFAIRKITPAGVVTTFAGGVNQGFVDGSGTDAQFIDPYDLQLDAADNVYVVDLSNSAIRKVTPAGVVTTLAGGTYGYVNAIGTASFFSGMYGIAVDASSNVYVVDSDRLGIRAIAPDGTTTNLCGGPGNALQDGTGDGAVFGFPWGLAMDANENVYVADYGHNAVRIVSPGGVVTTLAGDGGALVYGAVGIAVNSAGYVFVTGSNVITMISPAGVTKIIAGDVYNSGSLNGFGAVATFLQPVGIALDSTGAVYVADSSNGLIRKLT